MLKTVLLKINHLITIYYFYKNCDLICFQSSEAVKRTHRPRSGEYSNFHGANLNMFCESEGPDDSLSDCR